MSKVETLSAEDILLSSRRITLTSSRRNSL